MSKTDAFEAALLDLIFANANIATLGDATGVRGAVTAGQLFQVVALVAFQHIGFQQGVVGYPG